jgi:parvulin-like peptidyl-prolyl isomerase
MIHRYKLKHLSLVVGTVLMLVGIMPVQTFAVDDAIIAVVNDEVITLKDLRDYIHKTYVSLVADGLKEEDLKAVMMDLEQNGIDKLIEDKLMISRANQIGIDVRSKLVDDRMAELQAKYGSEQALVDALIKNGATITDLRNKILEQLKIKFAIDHEVKSKIFVNPQEVTQYFDQNKRDFQKEERVNLESIYIAFIGDKESALRRAQEALEFINKGEDFMEVSRKYSDTPSIGVVEKGQLLPEVEENVFKLREGEISSLIETDSGIYLFKLKGKASSQDADLKDVKGQIYKYIFHLKFKDRIDKWLRRLKQDAYIEIKE